jgi:hypothetical protein
MNIVLYRYDDHQVASFEDEIGRTAIYLSEHQVEKETPKGYWIGSYGKIWVSKTAKKRYAYPTKDEAWKSFQARKQRQIKLLSARLNIAKKASLLPRP